LHTVGQHGADEIVGVDLIRGAAKGLEPKKLGHPLRLPARGRR
jgi:hypothetical protein